MRVLTQDVAVFNVCFQQAFAIFIFCVRYLMPHRIPLTCFVRCRCRIRSEGLSQHRILHGCSANARKPKSRIPSRCDDTVLFVFFVSIYFAVFVFPSRLFFFPLLFFSICFRCIFRCLVFFFSIFFDFLRLSWFFFVFFWVFILSRIFLLFPRFDSC